MTRPRQTPPSLPTRSVLKGSKHRTATAAVTRPGSPGWMLRSGWHCPAGLEEALDAQALGGTDGLLTGTNLPNNNVNAVSTFALYLSGLLYGRVDGRYARTPGDVKMVVGSGTFTHASGAYKGNNSDESGVERLQEKSGASGLAPMFPTSAATNKTR